ncbi:hypothetical protein T440DRAFT_543610 [Plenodomus tracheiphilus IPT5]|uniref:Uncharacterized protein n=1 Tax=Plenodomus tracheiphilus IPT5 TaxID=1408161 RepID=A0A6A7AU88_9PLEO|nr:hypothetical protein T440DRAFT_543610 [Plenodomus tracheiphilus IPT5]
MSTATSTRAAALTRVLGQSGRRYVVKKIRRDKPGNQRRAYVVTCRSQKYVSKSDAPHDFKYFKDMFDDLRSSPFILVFDDAALEESLFA